MLPRDLAELQRVDHEADVAVGREDVRGRIECIVEEVFIDVEERRVSLAGGVVGGVVDDAELPVAVGVEVLEQVGARELSFGKLRIGLYQSANVLQVRVGDEDIRRPVASRDVQFNPALDDDRRVDSGAAVLPSFERRRPE